MSLRSSFELSSGGDDDWHSGERGAGGGLHGHAGRGTWAAAGVDPGDAATVLALQMMVA